MTGKCKLPFFLRLILSGLNTQDFESFSWMILAHVCVADLMHVDANAHRSLLNFFGAFFLWAEATLVSPLLSQHHCQHVLDDAVEGLALLGDVAAHAVLPYLITGQKSERQAAVEVLRKLGKARALKNFSIHHEDSKLLQLLVYYLEDLLVQCDSVI